MDTSAVRCMTAGIMLHPHLPHFHYSYYRRGSTPAAPHTLAVAALPYPPWITTGLLSLLAVHLLTSTLRIRCQNRSSASGSRDPAFG